MAFTVAIARMLLGALLLAAGGLKVGHPVELAAAIASFRLVPAGVAGPLAVGLPYLEILLGLYLVTGLFTRAAAAVAAVQFAAYAAAIASVVLRNIPANCGCFGPNDTAVADWPHVAMDVALAAIAALVAWRAPGAFALDRRFQRR